MMVLVTNHHRIKLILIFLIFSSCLLIAEGSSVELNSLGESFWSLSFEVDQDPRVIENINQGLTSEILFEIRVYADATNFLGLRGGSLVLNKSIAVEGRWDRFNEKYTLVQDGVVERYSSEKEFLNDFFSLDHWVFVLHLEDDKEYQLMIRSRVNPVRLHPPFTMLYHLENLIAFRNPWTKISFQQGPS